MLKNKRYKSTKNNNNESKSKNEVKYKIIGTCTEPIIIKTWK